MLTPFCKALPLFVVLAVGLFFELVSKGSSVSAAQTSDPNKTTITVAVVGPLTPSSKAFGIAHLQGITLAADEYNKEHQAIGRSITLDLYDDRADPDAGARIIESLDHSDATAVLGPANSSVSRAVIDRIQEDHLTIPVISSLSTASSLTKNLHTDYFLRANVSDQRRLTALLGLMFANDGTKPRRLLALYEHGDAFGEGMLTDVKDWLRTNDLNFFNNDFIEIPYQRDLGKESANELISQAVARGFGDKTDAVIVLGIAQDAVTFIEVIRGKDIRSKIYFNEPDALVFKSAAESGVPIAGVHILSVYWPDNATVNSFKPAFKKTFHDELSFSAALSYDAARLLFRSIDLALDAPVAAEDFRGFRGRVLANLRKEDEPAMEFALEGDHRFSDGEYRRLGFQGLQYNSRGALIRWDETPDEQPSLPLGGGKQIVLPTALDLMFVVVFGFLGSTFREFKRAPPSGLWQSLVRLASPTSLLIDPAISLIVFGCLFLLAILTKRSLLEVGGDAPLIYNVGSIAFGFVAGFLGIRALFAVIKRLGVNVEEKEIIGPVGHV